MEGAKEEGRRWRGEGEEKEIEERVGGGCVGE
jgi:hypothetical protein